MSGHEVQRPVCSCHGWGACVHDANYAPEADGYDPARSWNWHCPLKDCGPFSPILLVRPEWVPAEEFPPLAADLAAGATRPSAEKCDEGGRS